MKVVCFIYQILYLKNHRTIKVIILKMLLGNRYDLRDLKVLDVIPRKLFCKVFWYSNGIKREMNLNTAG